MSEQMSAKEILEALLSGEPSDEVVATFAERLRNAANHPYEALNGAGLIRKAIQDAGISYNEIQDGRDE